MANSKKPNSRFTLRSSDRRGQRPLGAKPSPSLWYGLAFLLLLGIAQMYYLSPAGRAIPYSEFKTLVKTGGVTEVIIGEQTIHGTLTQAPQADGQSKEFTTTRVEDPKLTEELDARSVKYRGEASNRWLPDLLGWILPLVFFIAIWGFFFRRMGGS